MSQLMLPRFNEPKEGVDFKFIENTFPSLTIQILSGDYKDIVYVYKYVGLKAISETEEEELKDFDDIHAEYNMVEEEPEEVRLSFDYEILENPNLCATHHHPDFEMFVGSILSVILVDATTNEGSKYTMFTKTEDGGIERLEIITPVLPENSVHVNDLKVSGVFARILAFFKKLFW